MRIRHYYTRRSYHLQFRSIHQRQESSRQVYKGPLKLQIILETIELDNYNRKYVDKQTKFKRQRKNFSESTSEDEQVGYTKTETKKKAIFTGNGQMGMVIGKRRQK